MNYVNTLRRLDAVIRAYRRAEDACYRVRLKSRSTAIFISRFRTSAMPCALISRRTLPVLLASIPQTRSSVVSGCKSAAQA